MSEAIKLRKLSIEERVDEDVVVYMHLPDMSVESYEGRLSRIEEEYLVFEDDPRGTCFIMREHSEVY
jgi:hypothetical protein